jgi:hypothetical protein
LHKGVADVKTTDEIVARLYREQEEHTVAGRTVAAQAINQQVIAHHTLARLRAERAALVARGDDPLAVDGLDQQIRYWLTLVDEDIETEDMVTDERIGAAAVQVLDDTKPKTKRV